MIGILEQNIIKPDSSTEEDSFFEVLNLDSYGLFYMYAPFRSTASFGPGGGAIRPFIIKRSNNAGDWYSVLFDDNNTISLDSLAKANDVGQGVPLSTILSNSDWDVVRIYSQLEPNYYHSRQVTNVGKMRFATAGVLEQKGGVFAPRWLQSTGFESRNNIPKAEFNSGEDISVLSIVSFEADEGVGTIFSTSDVNNSKFTNIIDRRSVSRSGLVSTTNGNFLADNIQQKNDSEYFIQVVTINGTTKKMKSYIEGVFQNEVTFAGDYTNNEFFIGSNHNLTTSNLDGYWGALLCASQEWDANQVLAITNTIKSQFRISD